MGQQVKEKSVVTVLEQKFAKLSQQIYEEGTRRIHPTWPWVLIRLVPKEQQYGRLYLPDSTGSSAQNKPLHEGIVLATWKAHWSRFRKPGEEATSQEVWRESDFEVGDRVLFPSFAGLPVSFLDEQHYRMVREWTFDPNGGVMCKVDYEGDRATKAKLEGLFKNLQSVTLSGK